MSLRDAQDKVSDFMILADQVCPETPTVPSMEVAQLRYNLMREELHEFWVTVDALYAFKPEDLLEQFADHIADMLYVTLGAAVAFGIDIDPIFDAVHTSNLTKFIDGHKREDGKWVKGPAYVSAHEHIHQAIRAQMD
jgi:predicted HAD superfamily Cof-like phosphohydrolase